MSLEFERDIMTFDCKVIFIILTYLIHEHEISFHLFVASSISFNSVFVLFSVYIFNLLG